MHYHQEPETLQRADICDRAAAHMAGAAATFGRSDFAHMFFVHEMLVCGHISISHFNICH